MKTWVNDFCVAVTSWPGGS